MIFTMGGETLDPVQMNHWQNKKLANLQCSLSGTAVSWHLRLHETYENHWSPFVSG